MGLRSYYDLERRFSDRNHSRRANAQFPSRNGRHISRVRLLNAPHVQKTLLAVMMLFPVLDRFFIHLEGELFGTAFDTVFQVGEEAFVGKIERM